MAVMPMPSTTKWRDVKKTPAQSSIPGLIKAILPVEVPDHLLSEISRIVNRIDPDFFPSLKDRLNIDWADHLTNILSELTFVKNTWESFTTPLSHEYLVEYTALRMGRDFLLGTYSSYLSNSLLTQYHEAVTIYQATVMIRYPASPSPLSEIDSNGFIDPNPNRRSPTQESGMDIDLWEIFCQIARWYNEHLYEYCVFDFSAV